MTWTTIVYVRAVAAGVDALRALTVEYSVQAVEMPPAQADAVGSVAKVACANYCKVRNNMCELVHNVSNNDWRLHAIVINMVSS